MRNLRKPIAIEMILGALAATSWGQVCDRWVRVADAGFTLSNYHYAVYDAQAGHVLMVSVGPPTNEFVETWAWDGVQWKLLADTGPSWRTDSAMSYDSDRGVTVFTAGFESDGFGVQDTWEWNGVKWTREDFGHILPVTGHDTAYDSQRKVTVLWGGIWNDKYPEHVYEWNGIEWDKHLTVVPSPKGRLRHAMTFDALRGVAVMFGGDDVKLLTRDDTWEWDGETWQERNADGPEGRTRASMIYDDRRGVCLLFGGTEGSIYFDDLWEWDGMSWRQVAAMERPPGRRDAGFAYDSDRGVYVLAGGYGIPDGSSPQPLSDTWEYTPCYPDCERDCDLDVFDYLCFLDKFVTNSPYCDFERDGDNDIFDFLEFQNQFVNGCG